MAYLSYAEPIEGNALLARSNSLVSAKSVMATMAHKNLPNRGSGYLSGEYPDGVTTIEGAPVSAEVRVLVRGEFGDDLDGAVVNAVTSAADGTWIVEGLDPDLKYDIVVRKEGYNDVMVTNVSPWNPLRIAESGVTAYVAETFSYAIPVIGGSGTLTMAVSGTLPSGISFSDGTLSGSWPTGATGEYPIVVTVTDGNGDSTSKTLTITLSIHPLVLQSSAIPSVIIGKAFSYSFSASGGEGPYVYSISAGALPAGLSLDSATGVISGTPTTNGAYSYTVTVTDVRSQSASKAVSGKVAAPPHKYWRINITAHNGNANTSIVELRMREQVGGANLTTGGTASANTEYSSGFIAAYAFDSNTSTRWAANGAVALPHSIGYEMASAFTVNAVEITAITPQDAPQAFAVQSSPDGVVWTTEWSVSGQTGWANLETRVFTRL